MTNLEEKLLRLGLSETLIRLYMAALQRGDAPVAEVAASAGMARTTAYDALARLASEGLVSLDERGGRRFVIAHEPTVLMEQLEARRQMLREVMPQLRSMYNRATGKPQIRFFQGAEGIRTVLWDTLEVEHKLLRATFSMGELLEVPGLNEVNRYFQERRRRNIWMRVIRSEERDIAPIWPDSEEEMRELRFAPPDFLLSMTTIISDSRVCMISSKRENYGLIIDSQEYAQFQASLFDAIWSLSTPPKSF